MRTAVLTISTTVARREAEDVAGPLLAQLAEEAGADVEAMEVIPDDFPLIEDRLHHFVDDEFTFVFTTGGTGLTPDDVTPEATKAVIEREAPGLAEAIRSYGVNQGVPTAALSRGHTGVRGDTLVVNLPGSRGGVKDGLAVLTPLLVHAVEQITGSDH